MLLCFEYPSRRGNVYSVFIPNGQTFNPSTDVVRLDDGITLSLEIAGNDMWVPSPTQLEPTGMFQGHVWKASLVFLEKDSTAVFNNNWGVLLPKIEAAAAVNTLFVVQLTEAEYTRLLNGGFEELKGKLSPRAASLVQLNPSSVIDFDSEYPALDLLHTCSGCR